MTLRRTMNNNTVTARSSRYGFRHTGNAQLACHTHHRQIG
ncbi:hypothetical protein HMPREF3227_00976 [Corynebacterium sp. CMW7794]|nr:hypothetical protein HMPREF0307_00924 [Corynebacterium sp. DNF00584]KXI18397.1 hypothetical protein HMPREF3227_00976 [Corynebacterium sp. CMW7794]